MAKRASVEVAKLVELAAGVVLAVVSVISEVLRLRKVAKGKRKRNAKHSD